MEAAETAAYTEAVRVLVVGACLAACSDPAPPATTPQTFEFGPFELAPGQEINNQCVSVTLDNDAPIYVNAVELSTGPGFHHSNWFTVSEALFDGPDGTWPCAERGYDEAVIGIEGSVLFAQSTQAEHEIQRFPPGVALEIPPRSRIVAGTHLLNSGDETFSVPLSLGITPIAEPTQILSAFALTNESIRLPQQRNSRFTMECDFESTYRNLTGKSLDFSFFYGLAHYHELGTGITIDAVRADGSSEPIFQTTTRIGDILGGPIEPTFAMDGFTKVRFSCNFYNPRNETVGWGVGDQEMCTILAFTDSEYTWGGGVLNRTTTPLSTFDEGAYVESTYPCALIAAPRAQ